MVTAGKLAKRFGLSRTALLHYDAIGLLAPSSRGVNRYRQYSDLDVRRLEQIARSAALACGLRRSSASSGSRQCPHRRARGRLEELNTEIERLRNQQRFILGLLKSDRAGGESA